ncbi:MAG: glycine--tRNA ligase subunit beta [Acetobacteraceae bacterium]|nr:glycine--tRNA ligase subunit beta [Acetobacteraceae bacterium]
MPEFLLELFSEEIPARMQARAAEDLSAGLLKALAPLMTEAPRGLFGPRRLAAVGQMAARAETAGREERGPRLGAPDGAIEGFLRKHGATRGMLHEQGGFWVLSKPGAVIEACDLIARALPPLLRGFPWPKSMRWGTSPFAWVRPLQRILCVFDGEAVRFALGEHGIVADDLTEGHRIMAGTEPFAVRSFTGYEAGLRNRFVVADPAERERIIEAGVARLAAAEGLEVVPDRGLLAEVAGLVEWPVPLLGRTDDATMDLPPEVMRTTMRVNQRYFSLCHPGGRPAARFAIVANIVPEDGGAAIAAGNERVLRARLSDARFFWDGDRRQSLESFLPKLDEVVFHAKLGTQGQRVSRLERLAEAIAPMVGADPALARRAARLAKADLASGMVGEFPELQGVMGRYYALHGGEDPRVAEAIGAHYRPLGPGDAVPREPVAVAVALADKLDQLAGFFDVDERPRGSGDPFALRRAALGVIRTIRENALRVTLLPVLIGAIEQVRDTTMTLLLDEAVEAKERLVAITGDDAVSSAVSRALRSRGDIARDILDFIAERLRVQLRAEGARHDLVAAVFGATPDDDLVRLLARAEALRALLDSPDGANLLAAYKRAANILRIEERRDGRAFPPSTNPALLRAPEEQVLAAALDAAVPAAQSRLAAEDFAGAMTALATLRAPIDAFFDRVTVNDPDPELRANRLGLLSRLRAAMDAVADLSKIEG